MLVCCVGAAQNSEIRASTLSLFCFWFVCVCRPSPLVQHTVRATMKSQGDQRTELHPLQMLLHQDARGVHRLDGAGGWGRPGVYRHVVNHSAEKKVAVSIRASFREKYISCPQFVAGRGLPELMTNTLLSKHSKQQYQNTAAGSSVSLYVGR